MRCPSYGVATAQPHATRDTITGGRGTRVNEGETMTTTLEVLLNARLPGPQRGDRYEDPLADWLEASFPGSRVTAGGTMSSVQGEPLSCGVRADVQGDPVEVRDAVCAFIEAIGAPRGSTVTVDGLEPRALGTLEGLAVYLDRHGLPAEVYAGHDVNELIDHLHQALVGDGAGRIQSFWEGPESTALYVYGESAAAMAAALAPVLEIEPLAAGARVERIA